MPFRLTPPAVATLAVVALLAACSKEAPPPKPRVSAPVSPTVAAKPAEPQADAGLKERLARQEAAAKMFDRKAESPRPVEAPRAEVAKPAPATASVPAAEPRPAPARVPESPKAAPEPTRAAAKPEAPRPEPAKAVEPPKVAAAPASAPPAAAPPVPAKSAAAPAPAPAAARVVSRVDPDFPREAVQAGADQGNVKARMTLDATGNVTRVEIIEANPRRVFDRAVVRALSQWRFDDGAAGRIVDTEVAFRR